MQEQKPKKSLDETREKQKKPIHRFKKGQQAKRR